MDLHVDLMWGKRDGVVISQLHTACVCGTLLPDEVLIHPAYTVSISEAKKQDLHNHDIILIIIFKVGF